MKLQVTSYAASFTPSLEKKLLSTFYHIFTETYDFVDDDLVIVVMYFSDDPDVSVEGILEAAVKYIDENICFKKPMH